MKAANTFVQTDGNTEVLGEAGLDWLDSPSDRGFVASNYNPVSAGMATIANTPALLKSSIYTVKIKVPVYETSTKVTFLCAAVDSGITACTVALFTDAGTKIAETADITTSSTLKTAMGVKFPSWATPVALTPGYYHVAFRFTSSTATSTLKLSGCIPAIPGIDIGNMGDSAAAQFHYATSGTNGSQASIPSTITMSSRVANTSSYTWFAI